MRADIEIYNKDMYKQELLIFVNPDVSVKQINEYCLGNNIFHFIIVNKDKLYYYDGLRDWSKDKFDMTEFDTGQLLKIFDMVPEDEERLFIIQILSFIYGVKDMQKHNLQYDDNINQLLWDLGAVMADYEVRFNAGNRVANIKIANMLS